MNVNKIDVISVLALIANVLNVIQYPMNMNVGKAIETQHTKPH